MNAQWHINQLLIVEESNVYDWSFFLFANTMTVLTVDFEMVSGAHAHDKNKQYYFCFLFFAIRAISVFWRNLTRNSRVRWWVFLNTFLVCHELKIRKLAGRIFFNKFFCCSIAQFIYIGFRCRKPNLKPVTLFKVVWRFYHKGCLIIHYNIHRHSGQTVVDSQVNNLFFTSASTSNKTILSVRGHCVTRWRDNSKLANQASTLLPFVVKKKKNETIKKTFTWSPIRPCAMIMSPPPLISS